MGKPRYRWWRYVRRMIRDYPGLREQINELHSQKITADMTSIPRGGGTGRTVEMLALRQLSPDDQKDYDAVNQAIKITSLKEDGSERLKMIRYMYWYPREHTVKDAAPKCNISEPTAKRWHGDFVKLVAKCHGFCLNDTPVSK